MGNLLQTYLKIIQFAQEEGCNIKIIESENVEDRSYYCLGNQTIYLNLNDPFTDPESEDIPSSMVFGLLHELGHFKTSNRNKDVFWNEYSATKWAISKAKEWEIPIDPGVIMEYDVYHFYCPQTTKYNFDDYFLNWDGVQIKNDEQTEIMEKLNQLTKLANICAVGCNTQIKYKKGGVRQCVINKKHNTISLKLSTLLKSISQKDQLKIWRYISKQIGFEPDYAKIWAQKMFSRHCF